MKLSFDELLSIASKKISVEKRGEDFFRWLIKSFNFPGENKIAAISDISDIIYTCLKFNGYYESLDPEENFWDYEEIKIQVSLRDIL